jgi:hypothetical protein
LAVGGGIPGHQLDLLEVAEDILLGKSGELSGSLLRIMYPQVCFIVSTCRDEEQELCGVIGLERKEGI